MSELKPCPFCGKSAKLLGNDEERYVVPLCVDASCPAGDDPIFKTEKAAATAWNSRPIETELLEALEEIVPELRGMATISPVAGKLLCKADKAINRARGKQP